MSTAEAALRQEAERDNLIRTRTIEWADPVATLAQHAGLSGLELMQLVISGEIPPPPIAQTMGMRFSSVDKGKAEFTLEPAEYHYNPIGSVHGSVYALLLDSACGCAVHTMLPAGTGYTSLDLNIKFLRGMRTDTGAVRCTGTVRHFGRRTALAEADIVDESGRLYATATSTCVILSPAG